MLLEPDIQIRECHHENGDEAFVRSDACVHLRYDPGYPGLLLWLRVVDISFDLIECIQSRRDPVAVVEQGHSATVLTIIGDIASRVGRKLTWDWKTQRFVGDDDANRFLSRPMRSPWTL